MIYREKTRVISQEKIAEGIYELWLETENIAASSNPGQFVMVYPDNKSTILPRPISICETKSKSLRLVYRVVGKGTDEFSSLKWGDEITVMGPLGNGYKDMSSKNPVLFGGGIGIPPMLKLAQSFAKLGIRPTVVLGYRDSALFLKEDFDNVADVYVATEDGSVGTKGNVLTAFAEKELKADVLYACGPMPMLRAIKNFAEENSLKAYISLEEKMACGLGACLACVCKTPHADSHSHVNNTRVCTEGPVFEAKEVEI